MSHGTIANSSAPQPTDFEGDTLQGYAMYFSRGVLPANKAGDVRRSASCLAILRILDEAKDHCSYQASSGHESLLDPILHAVCRICKIGRLVRSVKCI